MGSILDSEDCKKLYEAAKVFANSYERYRINPGGFRSATALASLGLLEEHVDVIVSRETSELEAKLDGTSNSEEPPF